MSSPGKASWCIGGAQVAGIDRPDPEAGLLGGQTALRWSSAAFEEP